jgi:predicted Zn-dependent protease
MVALATALSTDSRAYTTSGRWATVPVRYFVNTQNLDLAPNLILSAVQAGADTWAQQSNAAFAFNYAGTTNLTTLDPPDGTNIVLFRNASSGPAIATTYSWFSGSTLVDTDIVFWDGAFQFFAGSSGCSGGFYIEDIAAHEFGHALGLGHSTIATATMYPSTSYCNTANRSLDADDLAGVLAIYGARSSGVPNVPTGLRMVR